MKNYLKITIIIFLSTGIFFSLGLFALKIIFEKNNNDELVVLGPDNKDIFTIPKDVGGKKVSNLDIEILNNKKALVTNEKLRLPPTEPELLPLDVIEEKINNKTKNTKELKNNIIKDSEKKVKIPSILIYGSHDWAKESDRHQTKNLLKLNKYETINKSIHFSFLENTQEVSNIIKKNLSNI